MNQGRMNFLALSGSARVASTNTALLKKLEELETEQYRVRVCDSYLALPIFNTDKEGIETPPEVVDFCASIADADGIIISSPEYVHAIPGGIKNAIDWLVSRNEVMAKPIVLAHASPRGDDMLKSLRLVLATVSTQFNADCFLRIPLLGLQVEQIESILSSPDKQAEMRLFLDDFAQFVGSVGRSGI